MVGHPGLRYDVVDVFTDRAFAGNPLAVVHGAEALTTVSLQAIAREFNLSETAFPLPVSPGVGADYRVRIFTPATELPFAGHPSVGTAWVLQRQGHFAPGAELVRQECGAGVLDLRFDGDLVTLAGAAPRLGPELDPALVARAAGCDVGDLLAPPRVAAAGLDFAFAVVGEGVVDRCRPRPELLDELATGGLSVSSLTGGSAERGSAEFHTRVFAGGVGVDEDPATGSAALAFGVYAAAAGLVGDGTHRLVIRQGVAMGRPSLLTVTVVVAGGRASRVEVGGSVVPVANGVIAVPPVVE